MVKELFIKKVNSIPLENISVIIPHIEALKRDILSLEDIRKMVDYKSISQIEEIDFYKKLILAEDDLEQFYLNKSKEIEDKSKRDLVIKIAQEEAKHKIILENILKLMQDSSGSIRA